MLDDQVISSPQVDPDVACDVGITGGSTQITGEFTAEEAKDLAALIKGGALPVPVEVIEQRTVGPTLGEAAIDASAKAAVIGVAADRAVHHRRLPAGRRLATVALGRYALMSYAALVALGATLTLPGLAGFVLAIGMAVDANVLVFERAREEYAAGRPDQSLRSALTTGFQKAWTAIIDSNVTTLLAAGLLFFLASGPVRGLRRDAVDRRARLDGLGAGHHPGAGRVGGPAPPVIARPGHHRPRRDRPGPRLADRPQPRPHEAGRHVARRLARSSLVCAWPASWRAGWTSASSSPAAGWSSTPPARRCRSTTRARRSSDAGFPRAVVQESGDENISVRTGEMTNDQEAEVRAALEWRPAARSPRCATS